MAQSTNVYSNKVRYTRADFVALRHWLHRIAPERVMQMAYSEDELAERDIVTARSLNIWLEAMLSTLRESAISKNPYIAKHLDVNRDKPPTPAVLEHLVKQGELDYSVPSPSDRITEWFKPRFAGRFKAAGIATLADLTAYISRRNYSWYLGIQGIGAGKAKVIERWLRKHQAVLGDLRLVAPVDGSSNVILGISNTKIPLERMGRIYSELDGSHGANRAKSYCFIRAQNDLEALQAYLNRYQDNQKSYRAYRKELERFLLWCVTTRRIALSDAVVDDCEAYLDFLTNVPAEWCGPKAERKSNAWRPFVAPLSPNGKRYSVTVLKGFFAWLVDVRYLAGNPWIATREVKTLAKQYPIAVEKALPEKLWERLSMPGGILDKVCEHYGPAQERTLWLPHEPGARGPQVRLIRAAILLLGLTGIRREEATTAKRKALGGPLSEQAGDTLWPLVVIGKRLKERTVYLPEQAFYALAAHWRDRGQDLVAGVGLQDSYLLSPVIMVPTTAGLSKHDRLDGVNGAKGFSPDGLYRMVTKGLRQIAADKSLPLLALERELLRECAPHALRHTFATQGIANDVGLDTMRKLLGHTSLATTSIYVDAEQKAVLNDLRNFHKKRA